MKLKTVLDGLKGIAVGTAAFLMVGTAQAVPTLQVDIDGGTYDPVEEDVVAPDAEFTVRALLTPSTGATVDDVAGLLADTYYISIALTPKTAPPGDDFGSFKYSLDGGTTWVTVNVTADMVYGVPPLESNVAFDAGDLSKHGIYETYYKEVAITFDGAANQCDTYNVADNPGGCDTSGTGTYFDAIMIDASNLDPNVGLHFDLYNSSVRTGSTDVDVDDFAPFSHDGRYDCCGDNKVPEPSSLALLGIGLLGMGIARRRKIVLGQRD